MHDCEVEITEIVELTTGDEMAPVARMLAWRGQAPSQHAAREAAWEEWDRRYGPGDRPMHHVRVTSLVSRV